MSEAYHQQVGIAVIVVVEPERVGRSVVGIIAVGDACLTGYVRKGHVSVVAVKVVLAVEFGIGHEEIFEAVPVEIGYRRRGSQSGIALHDIGIGVIEGAVVMRGLDARTLSEVQKPGLLGIGRSDQQQSEAHNGEIPDTHLCFTSKVLARRPGSPSVTW